MWDVELCAERMRDAVHEAEPGVREPDSGHVAGQQQFGASLDVGADGDRPRQEPGHGRDDLQGDAVAVRVRPHRQVGLEGVGEGVHAGGRGGPGWQSHRQVRVEHRGARKGAVVADIELAAADDIRDHAERVHLRTCAGGRRHGDDREGMPGELGAVVEADAPLRVDGAERDALRRVHRRPAADRHDGLGSHGCRQVAALVDARGRRVGCDPTVDGHAQAGPFERGAYGGDDRGGGEERIGDDEGAGRADCGSDATDLVHPAAAEVGHGLGVEGQLQLEQWRVGDGQAGRGTICG